MTKAKRARYTLEFQAGGSSAGGVGPEHSSRGAQPGNGGSDAVQLGQGSREGKLKGADSPSKVSAEQMEISRLRAELTRVKMERDILGKATAYFAKGQK